MKKGRRSTRKIEELPSLFSEDEVIQSKVGPRRVDSDREDGALDDLMLDREVLQPRSRLRFISFGSGSSGNCSYVGSPENGLLVDAGVDANFVSSELLRNGISPSTIHGILLTHDHGDHISYVYTLVRRNPSWKIYATPRTIDGVLRRHSLSRRIRDYHQPIFKEHEYTFGDITVVPFETSHDGTDNSGFAFRHGACNMVICTDTGIITERADHYIRQATALMIESNYDDSMLTANPHYPQYLKARIRSDHGHLNNIDTARYVADIHTNALRHVFLCHLSDKNNLPEIALKELSDSLALRGIRLAASSAEIPDGAVYVEALPRYRSSDLFVL